MSESALTGLAFVLLLLTMGARMIGRLALTIFLGSCCLYCCAVAWVAAA